MRILECEDCGYERSSEQDGRRFHRYCTSCMELEGNCDCEDADFELLCDNCVG